jgi:NAD-dependent oxidoreductase involved in siderophore biosynthesis
MLAARLDAPAPLPPAADADRAELRALVADGSAELRAVATRLGRRVYAESPKAFARRLERYVEAAVAEGRPADG